LVAVLKRLAQPITFRAAGRPGIFLTRSLLDGNLLPYHICHVRHDGHDTTVLSKSIHSCRYDIKMTLVVAASRRGEGRGGEFASRRVCSVCFGKSCDIISRDQASDVLCQASLLQSAHCQNQQSHVFSYSCCRSAGNFP
jgi:hypothetical protein